MRGAVTGHVVSARDVALGLTSSSLLRAPDLGLQIERTAPVLFGKTSDVTSLSMTLEPVYVSACRHTHLSPSWGGDMRPHYVSLAIRATNLAA